MYLVTFHHCLPKGANADKWLIYKRVFPTSPLHFTFTFLTVKGEYLIDIQWAFPLGQEANTWKCFSSSASSLASDKAEWKEQATKVLCKTRFFGVRIQEYWRLCVTSCIIFLHHWCRAKKHRTKPGMFACFKAIGKEDGRQKWEELSK